MNTEQRDGIGVAVQSWIWEWLLTGIYHPPSQSDQYFFDKPDKSLDVYSNYENILLAGGFNAQIGETYLETFLYQHELKNVNKEPTCYKNSECRSCIDFILTNNPKSFLKTNSFFTGLSDLHKLVLTVFKTTSCNSKAKELTYRNFKNLSYVTKTYLTLFHKNVKGTSTDI